MELREYLDIIKKRFPILLLFIIISTLSAVIISFFVLPEVYESSTTLYAGKQVDSQEQYVYQDIMMGQTIVKDYRVIAKSKTVCRSVKEELKNEYPTDINLARALVLSDEEFSNKIEVSLKSDTRIIEIKVTDTDPVNCMIIANKTAEVFKEKVTDLLKLDNVQILDKAEQPISPVSPNKKMNIAVGFLMGAALGLGLIILIEYFDNTVKTPDDVVKYTNLTVIGVIPHFEAVEEAKN